MTNSCSDAQRSESQHNVLDAVPDAHFIFISRFYSCSHSSAAVNNVAHAYCRLISRAYVVVSRLVHAYVLPSRSSGIRTADAKLAHAYCSLIVRACVLHVSNSRMRTAGSRLAHAYCSHGARACVLPTHRSRVRIAL